MGTEVTFKIDSWTPKTLPLERLGQYLVELAALYGETSSVHFQGLRKGSAVLVSYIDEPAVPKVHSRISKARRFYAPADIGATFEKIDRMLAADNAKAVMRLNAVEPAVIAFPGRDRERPVDYGTIRKHGFIDGELVRIGGRDETVHLQLQDGETLHTNLMTDRELARRLSPMLYGPTLRLWGMGRWRRDEAAGWVVESFRVERFETLDGNEDLAAVIDRLQAIPGSHWREESDPIGALLKARRIGEAADEDGM